MLLRLKPASAPTSRRLGCESARGRPATRWSALSASSSSAPAVAPCGTAARSITRSTGGRTERSAKSWTRRGVRRWLQAERHRALLDELDARRAFLVDLCGELHAVPPKYGHFIDLLTFSCRILPTHGTDLATSWLPTADMICRISFWNFLNFDRSSIHIGAYPPDPPPVPPPAPQTPHHQHHRTPPVGGEGAKMAECELWAGSARCAASCEKARLAGNAQPAGGYSANAPPVVAGFQPHIMTGATPRGVAGPQQQGTKF